MYKEIIDYHKNDKALSTDDGFTIENEVSTPKKTTVGWEILVEFTNGETQWLPLKVVKESNPVQLAIRLKKNQHSIGWYHIHYVSVKDYKES